MGVGAGAGVVASTSTCCSLLCNPADGSKPMGAAPSPGGTIESTTRSPCATPKLRLSFQQSSTPRASREHSATHCNTLGLPDAKYRFAQPTFGCIASDVWSDDRIWQCEQRIVLLHGSAGYSVSVSKAPVLATHMSRRGRRTGSHGSRVVTSITAPAIWPVCSALTNAGSSTTGPVTYQQS